MNPVALCNIKVGAQNTHMCWDTLLCQSLERAEQGWAGVCSLMTEIVPSSSLSSSKPFSRLLSSRWSLLEFAWITLRLDHFLDMGSHTAQIPLCCSPSWQGWGHCEKNHATWPLADGTSTMTAQRTMPPGGEWVQRAVGPLAHGNGVLVSSVQQ